MIVTQQAIDSAASFNEAEVRFHVIDPVLRKLGYPGGEDVYLKLEEKLDYPYFFIGHKNVRKDVPLGFPDYRAGLKGRRGSFVVEAKAATAGISGSDVEQAHSYAAHSQVGANYFILSDGLRIAVYETLSGGQSEPILQLGIDEIDARFHELENVLSPVNLERNCRVEYDRGLKLGEGLGSSVQIHSGKYELDDWAYKLLLNEQDITELVKASVPQFAELNDQLALMQREFELRVSEGVAERQPDGRIVSSVNFAGVTKNNLEAMKLLGVDRMVFATDAEYISSSPDNPTVFESTADFLLNKGAMFPPLFGGAVPIETDVEGDIFVTARMYKEDGAIIGEYTAISDHWSEIPTMGKAKLEFDFIGRFKLRLIQ